KSYLYMGGFEATNKLFDGLMYILVVIAGALFMIGGGIAPAELVAYLLYVTTLIASIRTIVQFAEQFQRGMTGIERFYQIMDANIDIFDQPDAVALTNVRGDVTFDHVSFSYENGEPVLS